MVALYYTKIYESQAELEAEMREHLSIAAELRLATVDVEKVSIAKVEFLANMSHELRTALNAVINYSEMLLEDASSEGDIEATILRKIHTSGHHLLKLVNEVLDLSKIDAGMMDVFKEATNICDLVWQCVDEVCPTAASRNNVLSLISILVSSLSGESGDVLSVVIDDTGIGIAPNELPALFEQFSVLGAASSSKYGGTGLGLALSRKLCRLMGGDIAAQSTLGQGSCFTITLPISYQNMWSEGGATNPLNGEIRQARVQRDADSRLNTQTRPKR